jgi:hypothetical protein
MDIYVGHSSSIDFKEQLYQPLRNSSLDDEHNIVLPHEDSDEPFNSKEFLRDECDVFVAEVSEASTGLGIELGWADLYEVPVICVYREGSTPSSSILAVFDTVEKYRNSEDLVELVSGQIESE